MLTKSGIKCYLTPKEQIKKINFKLNTLCRGIEKGKDHCMVFYHTMKPAPNT